MQLVLYVKKKNFKWVFKPTFEKESERRLAVRSSKIKKMYKML